EPCQMETEPCQMEPEPCQTEPEPELCKTEPELCEMEPEPGQTEPEPCKTEPELCQTEPEPCQTEPEPCQTETEPEPCQRELGLCSREPEVPFLQRQHVQWCRSRWNIYFSGISVGQWQELRISLIAMYFEIFPYNKIITLFLWMPLNALPPVVACPKVLVLMGY